MKKKVEIAGKLLAISIAVLVGAAFLFTSCEEPKSSDNGSKGPVTYTVTFESNGGSSVASITGVASGAGVSRPADPTKSGFDFAGWYKETALTNKWNFDTNPVTANITLYAKWVAEGSAFTVTFNSNGGSAVAPMTGVESGDKITAPTPPTKAGSTFDGWYKESSFTNPWNFSTDMVTSSIILYAKWSGGSGGDLVPLTGFSIDTSISVEREGGTKPLTPVFIPSNATDKTVVYTSANKAIAEVDEATGVVTGVAPGNTTITAKPNGAPGQQKTVQVTVTLKSTDVKPGSIGLKESGGTVQTSFTVAIGSTKTFILDWGDTTPTSTAVTWEPAGDLTKGQRDMALSYAYPNIDGNGRPTIKGIGPGSQKFTLTSVLDPDSFVDITIVVSNKDGYQDPVDVSADDGMTYKWSMTHTVELPVRTLESGFNWGHVTTGGDHYSGGGYRLKDTNGYSKYTDAFEAALAADAAATSGKKSKVVFYYYKNYDNGTYSGSTAHYLQIGWTQKGVANIDGNVAPGQPVFRFEFPVEEFLRYENYVGTANASGADGDGSYPKLPKLTTKKNSGGTYDPIDFKTDYENTEEWYAKNHNKGQYQWVGQDGRWDEAFVHYNLGRVVLEVTEGWTTNTGAYLLHRIEIEMPE